MKLAEALKLRKDLRQQLDKLVRQIVSTAYDPVGGPETLISRANELALREADLNIRIDQTNMTATVTWHDRALTLLQARSLRDALVRHFSSFAPLSDLDSKTIVRGGMTEVDDPATGETKRVRIADRVQTIQFDTKKVFESQNQRARDSRELDTLLQQANWTVDLIE